MDEHIEPRVISDEALREMGRAIEKALGVPGNPVLGFAAGLVIADPATGEMRVAGSVYSLSRADQIDVVRVVRMWFDASTGGPRPRWCSSQTAARLTRA